MFLLPSWEWGVGALISLGIGSLVVPGVVRLIRGWDGWNGAWIGVVERVFFTLGAAYVQPQFIVPTMAAWITAKMGAGWLYDRQQPPTKPERMSGLAGNMASMAFALIGGLVMGRRIVAG